MIIENGKQKAEVGECYVDVYHAMDGVTDFVQPSVEAAEQFAKEQFQINQVYKVKVFDWQMILISLYE